MKKNNFRFIYSKFHKNYFESPLKNHKGQTTKNIQKKEKKLEITLAKTI